MAIIMLSGIDQSRSHVPQQQHRNRKQRFIIFLICRFERNGPNSTLQVDDHKKIVNTPDGKLQ